MNTTSNPTGLLNTRWKAGHVRVNAKGQVQIKLPMPGARKRAKAKPATRKKATAGSRSRVSSRNPNYTYSIYYTSGRYIGWTDDLGIATRKAEEYANHKGKPVQISRAVQQKGGRPGGPGAWRKLKVVKPDAAAARKRPATRKRTATKTRNRNPYQIRIGVTSRGRLLIGADDFKRAPSVDDSEKIFGSQFPHRVAAKTGAGWRIMTPTEAGKKGYEYQWFPGRRW